MRKNKHKAYNNQIVFTDMLFNLLLGITLLFLLAFLLINPKKPPEEGLKKKAEFIIRITWQEDSIDDVDLWGKGPDGKVVMFATKESGSMHLERDDLGVTNDVRPDGTMIKWNEEDIVIRGITPGWYQSNVHLYRFSSQVNPIVKWELIRINPTMKVVASGEVTLSSEEKERTLIRFRIDENGEIAEKDFVEMSLIEQSLEQRRETWGAPPAGAFDVIR